MQTDFIQEEETQILKSIKAIRVCISHIKKVPQNFSSSGIASSYISAPYPYFARSVHRLTSCLSFICQHRWKMWNFRKLVSKQHQQANSDLASKRRLICRVTTRSDHWPAKKPYFFPFPDHSQKSLRVDWHMKSKSGWGKTITDLPFKNIGIKSYWTLVPAEVSWTVY